MILVLRTPWCCLLLLHVLFLAGCASVPNSSQASRQQQEADLVVHFQSWDAISFIKPDISGTAGSLVLRPKTFRRDGIVKLLNNLKMPRQFVVVVLDRRYEPDPMTANGGMDAIQKFFMDLGFRRVAFQDGADWNRNEGLKILRDTERPAALP